MRLSVTGHQPPLLGGFSPEAIKKLDHFARLALYSYCDSYGSPSVILTGMAPGWDLAMAKAAKDAGIPYIAVLAHKDQGANWPEEAREELDGLLKAAISVDLAPAIPGVDKWTSRDLHMLDRSDIVLALWSGSDGGTARAVRAARERRLDVVNVWKNWMEIVSPSVQ